MSTVRFLCDEHLPRSLKRALIRQEPGMDILRMGEAGAPAGGTLDPDLLLALEADRRALISRDRKSLPDHMRDHLAAGHHTWGIFLLKRKATWKRCIDDLILIWSASEAEEWCDRLERLPWD